MKIMLFPLHVLISSCMFYTVITEELLLDPCANHKQVPNTDKRDGFNKVTVGVKLINDRFLTEGWYHTGDARTFLEAPPGFQRCGTLYPIWRQKKDGDISTMCIQTDKGDCDLKFNIASKLCGTEEIYNLKRSPVRNAAYCFAPVFAETPVVETHLVHKDKFKSELEFHCKFDKHPEPVFYRTYWLIDGKALISADPGRWSHGGVIQQQALTEDTLRESAGVTTLGFEVRCSVRVSYEVDKPASVPVWSETQFIGIRVSKTALTLKEGESEDITLQLTAPFGCGDLTDDNICILNIEAYNIKTPEDCKQAALVSSLCGTTIKPSQWNDPVNITVFGKISQDYGSSSHVLKLKLKTETLVPPRLWSDYSLGQITIQLTKDTAMIEGKSCYAINDPHMKTFDGRRYEHQFDGMFTMYKHDVLPIEVQIRTTSCGYYQNAWCNCGLSVRAGKTVFELNRCPGHTTYWSAEYTLCEDGGDVLQVKRKGRQYEVYLPTGGKVEVNLGGAFLNVYIFPSVQDVENSAGLCGKLSGVCSDDFFLSDGSYSTDKTATADCGRGYNNWANLLTEFSNSWRIGQRGSLFNHANHEDLTPWPKANTFCSCPTEAVGPREDLTDKVVCTATEARDICSRLPGFTDVVPNKCTIQERRKRRSVDSVRNKDKRIRRQVGSWSNDWTEDKAKEHCERLFQNSKSVQACGNVTGVETTGSIDNCVLDIQLTGTTEFGSFSLDTVRSKCLREVVVNPVLKQNTSVTNQSVYDVVVAQACSNDCSGHGTCDEGKCVCGTHYGGEDCSVDLRLPPELAEVENDGHCDTSRDTCHVISIYGETFMENGTKCQVEELKANRLSLESKGTHITEASILSINHIQCSVPTAMDTTGSDDTAFVRAYRISVANSGALYSRSLGAMVYDRTCIKGNISETDFSWTIEGPYCLYKGKCIANKEKHPGNSCWVCDVTAKGDNRTWTNSTDASCNTQSTTDFTVIPVVAGIAGVVVLVVIAAVVVWKVKRNRKAEEDKNITVLEPLTTPRTAPENNSTALTPLDSHKES